MLIPFFVALLIAGLMMANATAVRTELANSRVPLPTMSGATRFRRWLLPRSAPFRTAWWAWYFVASGTGVGFLALGVPAAGSVLALVLFRVLQLPSLVVLPLCPYGWWRWWHCR